MFLYIPSSYLFFTRFPLKYLYFLIYPTCFSLVTCLRSYYSRHLINFLMSTFPFLTLASFSFPLLVPPRFLCTKLLSAHSYAIPALPCLTITSLFILSPPHVFPLKSFQIHPHQYCSLASFFHCTFSHTHSPTHSLSVCLSISFASLHDSLLHFSFTIIFASLRDLRAFPFMIICCLLVPFSIIHCLFLPLSVYLLYLSLSLLSARFLDASLALISAVVFLKFLATNCNDIYPFSPSSSLLSNPS